MTATTTRSIVQQDPRAPQQRFIDDVINAHDLERALGELVAENFVELNPLPGQGPGRAGLAESDRVLVFSTWTGPHHGEFMGIPATGRTVTIEA